MDETGFRLDIQGLRGFALLLMLGAHASVPFLHGGFVGLEIFYVLSGFLITQLIVEEVRRTGDLSLLRFYARRARRLLPLAATVLAVVLVASLVMLGSVRGYAVAGDVIASALYFSNWHFIAASVDYFQFDNPAISPVQHYWSLSFEEQFYVAWPLVVVGVLWLARRARFRPRTLLWAVLAALSLSSLAYSVWFSPIDPQVAYFSTLTRIWEVGVGCALALSLPRVLSLSRAAATTMSAGGLAVIVWSAVTFSPGMAYPGWRALLPTLASAAVIVAGTSVAASGPIRALSIRPLQHVGKISYAWYLWHWPALTFAAVAFGELTTLRKIAVTALAWVPAVLSHHLIEERFRRSPTLARHPRRAVGVGFTCTAGAVVLAVVVAALQPSIPTAAGNVAGAAAVTERHAAFQARADRIRPSPRDAEQDREQPYGRCHVKEQTSDSNSPGARCVFGARSSKTTVINIGDSHGLMYSPAVIAVAHRRGWRVVNLTRAGCVVADVSYNAQCDSWRENSLRRVEREHPALIVVSTATDGGEHYPNRYAVLRGGSRLSRDNSEPLLEAGFRRTLSRFLATGARVVVIRDLSWAPQGIVQCVSDHPRNLRRCAFRPQRSNLHAFDARAARGMDGVKLVDPLKVLCRRKLCPAVIGDALVYRNRYHLTATFAATLAPWLGRRLPKRL